MADQILQTAQAVLRDPGVRAFLNQLSGQISKAVEEKLSALGIRPVSAEVEEAGPVAVLTEEQKIKLQNVKNKMERAENNLKEYQALKNKFFTKWFVGTSVLKDETAVEKEYQTAKADYEKLKREFGV